MDKQKRIHSSIYCRRKLEQQLQTELKQLKSVEDNELIFKCRSIYLRIYSLSEAFKAQHEPRAPLRPDHKTGNYCKSQQEILFLQKP